MDAFQEANMLRFLGLIVVLLMTCPALAGTKEVYVNAPSFCHKAERVDGDEVHLRSADKSCTLEAGKIPVKLDESIRTVRIYVDDQFWQEQDIIEFGTAQLREFLGQAEKGKNQVTIPENVHKTEAEKKAGELTTYYRSDEFQRKVQSERERFQKELFKIENKSVPYSDSGNKETQGKLPRDERIYILVSSSMPLQTIRNYVKDIAAFSDPNIVIVMRGFVNGMKKIMPTLDFIQQAVVKDLGCDFRKTQCEAYSASIQIDPLVFRRFGIESVPAFVYARNVQMLDPTLSAGAGENTKIGDFMVIKGDVSLPYALEVFGRETKSSSIKEMLQRSTKY